MVDHVLGTLRLDLGRPPVHEGGLALLLGRRLPAVRGARPTTAARSRRTTRSPSPTPTTSTCSTPCTGEDLLAVRSQAYDLVLQRLGARLGQRPDPPARPPAADLRRCSASTPRRRRRASGSCSTRSATARRRTPGSRSASTGWSRILAGEDNIREVIAFPKTQSGADPLTGAPTPVDDQQLRELGLQVRPKK